MLSNTLNIFKLKYLRFAMFSDFGNYGRLGNQLFQYSAVRSYSLKYDVQLFLPEPSVHKLDNFHITSHYVKRDTLQAVKRVHFKEKQFHYDPDFFQYKKKKDFKGYFQTEKYFKANREILLNELSLKDKNKNDYCKKYINKIKSNNIGKYIVAIHNRRGDYVPSKETGQSESEPAICKEDVVNYHPLLRLDYFEEAKKYFSNAIFLVFSNNQKDIQWCKNYITGNNHYYSEGHDDLTDLFIMKYCDHHIIANSSFSWWAAWLNQNPNQLVIAPKKWFGEGFKDYNMKDLYPENWVII